jgi:hypothetical protein
MERESNELKGSASAALLPASSVAVSASFKVGLQDITVFLLFMIEVAR